MFMPKEEYIIKPTLIKVKDFFDNKNRYTVRPPYQRKSVWSLQKKQALLDSLFRKFYIPRIVIRDVKTGPETIKSEIVDGQQRILTVQEFFNDELSLPISLSNFSSSEDIGRKKYSDLSDDIKLYVNELFYDADIIKGIDDPRDRRHQSIATQIFRRLQEGEPLNFMEKLHARLSSTARNFLTLYADDIGFDLDNYEPLDSNPKRQKFFNILDRDNDRMEHLAFLAQFLLIEIAGGSTDIGQKKVQEFVIKHDREDGIGKYEFLTNPEKGASKETLQTLNLFYDIFKDDISIDKNSGVKELSTGYFIISLYMLLRHLRYYYIVDDELKAKFKDFVYKFYQRWQLDEESDQDISRFSDKRQQDAYSLETRDRIVRQSFFEFYPAAKRKDTQRAFNEAQRIKIYRDDDGKCQACLKEGISDEDAKVPWSQYDADHILAHSKGGPTDEGNAQVLCRNHNRSFQDKSK
mgnify:CR=1 FL=1|tara:strand:+ start:477 stop:1868 length:1392 start_codon:yes stop_codon:yes gene_type:complete